MCCGGGGSPPAPVYPAAPDYTGAAQATAAGNKEAAIASVEANRVNQVTPYGNLTYSQIGKSDAGNPLWQAKVTLSPDQQKLLDSQNAMSQGLADVGQKGVGYVADQLNNKFDWNTINQNTPAGQAGNEGWQRAYDAIMTRQNPQFVRDEDRLKTQLYNQGIREGTEAWGNAMDDLNRKRNDFALAAQAQAGQEEGRQFGLDNTARQQAIQEQSFARNEPLNMLNAVRSGSQVTNPNFVGVPQQATTAGPDYLGAAQAGYNAQMGQVNSQLAQQNAAAAQRGNTMNGLFGLAGAALPYFI